MQHNDIGRTGQNLTETSLTTVNVNHNTFGHLYSVKVDGEVYAQPLYVSSLQIPGSGTHSVLYVATQHDSVYALDVAAGGAVLWQATMLDAAHGAGAGATSVPASDAGCPNSGVELGIIGTPVIDKSTQTIYLVAVSYENNYAVQRLHALDLTTGQEKFGGPTVIQASVPGTGNGSANGISAFDPKWQIQRAGLLLLNGNVYISWAGYCDSGPYHGWVMAYSASTLTQTSALNVTPNGVGSGIWMSGTGLAGDNINGNPRMFLSTGNGSYDSNQDYGDDVLSFNLSKGLQVSDSFTPYNQFSLSQADLDLSSGGILILPDQPGTNPHLAVSIGKAGELYLLNRDALGGYNSSTDNVVQEFAPTTYFFGVPSYWNGNIYFWPTHDHLRQYSLTNGLLSTSPVTVSNESTGFFGMTQSISANQTQSGTGVVWSIDWHQTPEVVYAHDAGNVANTLWSSAQDSTRDSPGSPQKFTVPTIADGTLFVAAEDQINFYGLLNSPIANEQQDFSLAVSPGSFTLNPGDTGTGTVTLTSVNGFTGGVTLSASGLPASVTANFVYSSAGSFTLTLTTTQATPSGTYSISINGVSTQFTHTMALNLTVNAASSKYIPFVTGQNLTRVRNNYSGLIGMQLTIGPSPVTVSALGRYVLPGSGATHQVKLVASNGTDIPGGSVSIAVGSISNQFQYVNLAQPIVLSAKTTYFLVSLETAGGDQWYDLGPVTYSNVAQVDGAIYNTGGSYVLAAGSTGQSYVPVNLLYDSSTRPTSAAVTTPTAAATVSGKSVPLTAVITPGPQLTVTSAQFQIDGMSVGAALAAAPYNTTFDSTLLTKGSHTLTIVVLDSGGTTTISEAVAFTVNNGSGVVVTCPAAGATVSGKTACLAANATSNAGLSIVSVQFRIDGTNTGAAVTVAPFATSFDSTKFADGPHTVTAVAVDSTGTSTTSAGVTFTVNNAATSVVVTTPAPAATVSGSAAQLAAAVTPGGGLAITNVQFKIDGTNAGAAVTSPSYAATFDSTALTNGSHTATAVVLDSSGTSTVSAGVTFNVSNTSTGPTPIPLLTGFTVGSQRNNFSGNVGLEITVGSVPVSVSSLGRIYISGNSSAHVLKLVQASNGADVPGGSISVNVTSGTVGQFTYAGLAAPVILAARSSYYLVSLETSGGDSWYDITPVTSTPAASVAGPVYFDGRSYVAAAGFSNESYVPLNLLYSAVSGTPPTVTITAPAPNASVSGSALSVTATASAASGATIANVQFQVDGSNFGIPQTATPFTQTLNTTTLTNGAHALTAVATDSSGNSATSSPVSVTIANAPATVTLTVPIAGATVTGTSVTISATATAATGLTIGKVQFQVDGTNLGNAITAAPYTTAFNSTSLTNGTHILTAVATDSNSVPATSPAVSVTSSNVSAPPSGTALLTGFTAGTLRNNFSSYVGMQLTVGSTAITVTALGRIYVSGNTASHTVKLVNASTGTDVAGGSVTITPSGTAGQFTYVSLPNPVSMAANTSYDLVSLETSGGDKWYDLTPVTGATVASVTAPVYYDGSKYVAPPGLPNQSYVPVNLQYSTVAIIPPTVSITSPISGATVSGSSVPVTASASAAAGLSIANVQFQVDGTNFGIPQTATPFTQTLNTTTLTNGAHALTAVATDSSGNSATSSPVSVTIANAPATVTLTVPIAGATVTGTSVTISATATAATGLTIGKVQFQVDGTNLGNAITAAPYTTAFNSTSLTNGTHILTAVATDSNGVPATSPAVSVTSSNVSAPPSGTALLTGFTAGTLRNNFSSYVGMQLTVGSTAITVTALGRIYVSGNTASHTVKLVNASTGTDVAGGSVTITPSGTAGQFTYVSLPNPVSMAANTSYDLVSLETSGGDKWYDLTPVTGATVASVTAPVYYDGSKYVAPPGLPNQSYVPVNLQYSTVAIIPPTVSITSPISGATVSGSSVPVTASASAAAGLSIANVQFQVDGTNIGSVITAAPYATAFNSTSLTNGTHSLTAIATDSSSVMAASAAISVTASNASAPPSGVALLTGFSVGSLRNNFSGYVGMQLTVGSSAVSVTSLGRIYVSGNNTSHIVKLVNAGTGADVPGGSASVSPASGTAGQFAYATLPNAITLAANTSYYLVSQEISGGDKWYDITTVTAATVASIVGPVYFDGTKYVPVSGLSNESYVPVNLQYSTAVSTAPTVSITSPIAGATVSGSSLSVTAAATPSSGLSIAGVWFYVDSVAIGSAVTAAPYSVFLDTTTLSNGTHALTALAQDSAGGATTSPAVPVLVSNGGGTVSGTSLLTGFTPGTLRNNYSGYVGMQFKVLATPITVTSLGRIYLAGNTGNHFLKLVVASTGIDVPGGSVSVNLPSGTAGQFAYVALAAPLTLSANTTYYLVSLETSGGDNWYDITGIAGTTAASLGGPVYYNGFSYILAGSAANESYVPLSLLYHL